MGTLLRVVWQEVKEALVTYDENLLLAFAQEQPDGALRPRAEQAASLAVEAAFLLIEPLSPQERRVLRLLTVGLSKAEIAKELFVSINTIKTQVQSIYRKLNVHSAEARDPRLVIYICAECRSRCTWALVSTGVTLFLPS